jgi:hypothetical protein
MITALHTLLEPYFSEVACDLAAHRESDQREILQLQMRDQLVQANVS